MFPKTYFPWKGSIVNIPLLLWLLFGCQDDKQLRGENIHFDVEYEKSWNVNQQEYFVTGRAANIID